MSGVTVATIMRSTAGSTSAISSARRQAGSETSDIASSGPATALADARRSRIHSSEVSTCFASRRS